MLLVASGMDAGIYLTASDNLTIFLLHLRLERIMQVSMSVKLVDWEHCMEGGLREDVMHSGVWTQTAVEWLGGGGCLKDHFILTGGGG